MTLQVVHRMRPRAARTPREAPPATDTAKTSVFRRAARAAGTAASALPESRAVQVGVVVAGTVASVVAAHPGIWKAGLTAAGTVPVLRPYVKVAVAATGAVVVLRRVARAKTAATDALAALRVDTDPEKTGMAHAGNGFDPKRQANGFGRRTAPRPAGSGVRRRAAALRRTSTELGREP